MHPVNQHESIILAPLRGIGARDIRLWAILLGAVGLGGFAYLQQWNLGLGVTGMNRPVYWGVYLTNFVFFIGLAHSGTFISAILRLAGAGWRKPLTRAAEAITLFSLPFGVASILIDMGRPDRALNIILYGRFESPLLWDFTAVSLYMLSSVVFFYLSLLPDIALCRDRLTDAPGWQRRMYELLALGWEGRPGQFHRLERVLDGMAIFMTMLVVTVHTVVSWVFGMTLQPGWHTALIGPFFLIGAIFSGTAAVVIVLAILRRAYHLEAALPVSLFNSLRKLLIVFTLGWLYMMVAEYLTTFYGNTPEEMQVFWQKFTGDFSLMFWAMTILVFVVPLLIFIFRGKDRIGWMVAASVMINIGMWIERYIVIVPTETRPRLLTEVVMGVYHPTWIEGAITLSLFGGLVLLYAVFTRLFPIVPVWETAEAAVETEEPPTRFRRVFGVRRMEGK
ncbi:MAG: polysulfide reductase NrfD [Chloroflexi bacterium]|nr:polysulfide reductase NrfD [Chloroflexota bacterium]MBI3177261.1 polysulfide reductase NrfD [Chloroflexota bacterium]